MKIFFKSTVSTCVLLSALAIQNSSFAGNSGNGGEKNPDDKKGIIKQTKRFNKKSKNDGIPNFEETAIPTSFAQNIKLDQQGTRYLLLSCGLEPKTLKNTAMVCKDWKKLIIDAKKDFCLALKSPKTTLPFLSNFFMHSSACKFAFDVVGPQFPYQTIYSRFNPALALKEKEKQYLIPQNISNYVSIVDSTPYHLPLSQYLIHLNPLKFESVGLGAYMIQHSLPLQKLLSEELEKNPFDLTKFSELAVDLQNHKSLKKHLMTLKLLVLSGDSSAEEKMSKWEGVIRQYCEDSINSLPNLIQNSKGKNIDFFCQPLWSTYLVNTGKEINTGKETVLTLDFMGLHFLFNSNYKNKINSNRIEEFAKYVKNLAPQMKGSAGILYSNAETLNQIRGHHSSSERFAFLDEQYKELDKENLLSCSALAYGYFEAGQYETALKIMQEVYEKAGNSPIRFSLLQDMAQYILQANDQANFPKAYEYLLALKNEFEQLPDGEDALEIDYTYRILEEGQEITKTVLILIFKSECVLLLSNYQIFLEDFDAAYKALKGLDLEEEMDLERYPELVRALNIKKHLIPKKLMKLFKSELKRMAASKVLDTQKLVCENQELFDFVFKKNLLDQRVVKKSIKSIKQDAQQDPTASEDEELGEEKNLSLSKKKDKKDKK